MISTVKFSDKHSVELEGSAGWIFVYLKQFGHDILPDIMPIIEAVLEIATSMIDEDTDTENLTLEDFFKAMDSDVIDEVISILSGIEVATILRIVWAMAKAADESVESPEKWYSQFDVVPLDVLIPEVYKIAIKGLVSRKNSTRLLKMTRKKASAQKK